MVKFGVPSVQETMVLAERAASEVSKIFPAPIRLEFEKVHFLRTVAGTYCCYKDAR
jgi:DNA polymerase delta subunit 1